jgi:hypothetical protein
MDKDKAGRRRKPRGDARKPDTVDVPLTSHEIYVLRARLEKVPRTALTPDERELIKKLRTHE